MKQQKVFRVLVAMPLGAASGRKIMSGIYRFLGEGYSWDVELIRRDTDFIQLFKSDGFDVRDFDGMIVAFAEQAELRRKQAKINLPTVFVDYPDPVRSTIRRHAFVHDDERSIAGAASQHLLTTGSRASFAFVPARTQTEWSARRQSAFVTQMKMSHRKVIVFEGDGNDRNALGDQICFSNA